MNIRYTLADAERDVMEVLWEQTEPTLTRDLLDMMVERGRIWKRQTLNTLLARLEQKDVVTRKRGYVQAKLDKEELLQKQTQKILSDFYEGKLTNFCAALIGRHKLKNPNETDLMSMIDELQIKEKGL